MLRATTFPIAFGIFIGVVVLWGQMLPPALPIPCLTDFLMLGWTIHLPCIHNILTCTNTWWPTREIGAFLHSSAFLLVCLWLISSIIKQLITTWSQSSCWFSFSFSRNSWWRHPLLVQDVQFRPWTSTWHTGLCIFTTPDSVMGVLYSNWVWETVLNWFLKMNGIRDSLQRNILLSSQISNCSMAKCAEMERVRSGRSSYTANW